MKKNIIFAAFAAASALLLVSSCAKEELRENISAGDGKVFSAVINQGLSKTTITSEYKVNWVEGDQIDINGGTTYSATPDASDATKATFTKDSGSDPDGTLGYTAVYPASIFKNGRHELPATQTYAAGKFNAPMCAISETESLEFKNFCGVLCFALKGTDKVKSIAVTANEQLCGPFEFADATSIIFGEKNKGYTVTLDCGEGVQLSATDSTNFYISLPPATYTAGMKIVITNTEGKTIEKTTTKSATITRNQIYTFNWTASFSPAGALKGEFSVSADKKVRFSQGNLTYNVTSTTWAFYEHQYDCATGYDADLISLFTWGYNENTSIDPEGEDYVTGHKVDGESFSASEDWGSQIGDGKTWRTLTTAEWQYLFNTREASTVSGTSNARYAKATVDSRSGIILLPDIYEHPSGVAELKKLNPKNDIENDINTEAAFTENTYSVADWEKMEAAGAVFLPSAGYRNGSSVEFDNNYGAYWSSTALDDECAYCVDFASPLYRTADEFYFIPDDFGYRDDACSVRLVTDVPAE